MRCLVALCALLSVAIAHAEPPATIEQRVGAQIGTLVIQSANLQLQIEQLQAALQIAQSRVRALEDKYEPRQKPE